MKKLTAGIFATLLAVVSVGAAHAEIASKGYVDQQVGTKADASTVTSLQGTVSGHTSQIGTINDTIGGYGDIVTHDASEFATAAQGAKADTAVQPAAITDMQVKTNLTTTLSGTSTDTQYPSAKAVWDTIQAETSDIASSGDLSALTTRVGTLETASATHATKTELTDGLAEKLDTATAATTYATKTELAGKQNTIAGAQLEALNSGITADKVEAYDGYAAQISGKLDTATADGKYAVKSTEGVASTASTNAQKALTNIGTLTNLTTEAKTNTVAAINEVASEAAAAASAASAADTKAGQAQSAATAAQGDVDALEAVVNHETTGLAAAHTAIDALESGKLDKTGTAARATADASGNVITETYATKAEIENLATDANLALKQDKTDNSLATTNKTVVGAINEVRGTANTASSTATAAQSAASAAQADATQALEDAATAQSAAEAAQDAADLKLPTATYNSQVGTVSATNMGTTASTVVTAIKEVAGEASTAQSTATAAQQTATQAQQTANAAIPAPDGECADGTAKCVLTFNNSAYAWEVIARDGEGE